MYDPKPDNLVPKYRCVTRLITIEDFDLVNAITEFSGYPEILSEVIEGMMPKFELSKAKEGSFANGEVTLLKPGSYPLQFALQNRLTGAVRILVENGASLDENTCRTLGDSHYYMYLKELSRIQQRLTETRKFAKPADMKQYTVTGQTKTENE